MANKGRSLSFDHGRQTGTEHTPGCSPDEASWLQGHLPTTFHDGTNFYDCLNRRQQYS